MQNSVNAVFADLSAPPRSELSSSDGATKAITTSDARKITVKITFINYVYKRYLHFMTECAILLQIIMRSRL